MSMPDDLQAAYRTFVLLTLKHGMAFAGCAMTLDPPAFYVLGNVNERGKKFADLLREYANVVELKTEQGLVEEESVHPKESIN